MMKNLSLIHPQEGPLSCVVEAPLQMTKTTTTLSALELLAFFVDECDGCSADVLAVLHRHLCTAPQVEVDCETSWHDFWNAEPWYVVPCVGS